MLRKNRYLAVLEFGYTLEGYRFIKAKREKQIALDCILTGMGIFRSKRQAESILQKIQRDYFLCPRLLGLEKSNGACFSYHLKQCSGACIQAIPFQEYNTLFEQALNEYTVPAWERDLIVEEKHFGLKDIIHIKNWNVVKHISNHLPSLASTTNFEFDNFKIIRNYLLNKIPFST